MEHQTDINSEPPLEPNQMGADLQAYEGLDGELAPGQYYHEPSGDAHSLDDLKDGPNPNSKPFYPYSTLIRYAIKGSPNQRLLLEDIYFALASRFPYFRTAPPGWKNSIRHNLSLNPCFEKIPRPLTDRGKGHYWTVNDSIDPRTGVHRVRKKKSKGSKNSAAAAAAPYPSPAYDGATSAAPTGAPEVPNAGPSNPPTYPYALAYPDMTQYDQSGYPIMPPVVAGAQQMQMHPDMQHAAAEQQQQHQQQQQMPELPTVNAEGMPIWKNIWHNELSKLWLITMHQDRAYAQAQAQAQANNGEGGEVDESTLQAHESWYQVMAENLKRAFQPVHPQDGQENQGEEGEEEEGANPEGMEEHNQYV